MTTQPSPSLNTVGIFGHDIDVNDDAELARVLGENAIAMIEPLPPVAAKHLLLQLIVDIRLCAVKFGFVLQRAHAGGHGGVGIETCSAIYNRLLDISELDLAGRCRSE